MSNTTGRADRTQRAWWLTLPSRIVHLCAAALLAGPGCTTMQTIQPSADSAATDKVRPGDALTVSLHDGRELELDVVEWTDRALVGRNRAGAAVTIGRNAIARVQVKRVSYARTAGAAGLVLLLGLAILIHDLPVAPWPAPPQ